MLLKLHDLLRISIRQVFRQRRRYTGVILAIAIGTAGLIVIITMGRDVKANLNLDLDLLGGVTRVKIFFEDTVNDQNLVPKPRWFTTETLNALRLLPGVSQASLIAFKRSSAFSSFREKRFWFKLVGVDKDFWAVNSFTPIHGELFDAGAVAGRQRVCVLGAALARKIFGTEKVAGLTLPIDQDLYLVTGVLGGADIADRANYAFIPLTTAQDRIQDLALADTLYVRCRNWNDVGDVVAAIPSQVKLHQSAERVAIEVAWEQLARVKKIAWWMEFFIYVSVAATLILGGFGIWNGMMATVLARTREIGLKKAIGAEDRDIRTQFLIESLCLSLGSAVVGVGLSRLTLEMISLRLKSPPPEDLFIFSVALSLLFSVILGAGAGYAPSMLASRMEVVSALRYE
jgi:putative ABC transport system permease protein